MKNVRREDWETLKPTVYGWGINDVNYNVTKHEVTNGTKKIIWVCPYYKKWVSIIKRCFCAKFQEVNPTYKGCTIAPCWKYLSNFIEWVDSQPNRDWQNCEPDKDFLSGVNKHYSPQTVVFVSGMVNSFIKDRANSRGLCLIGVSYYPNNSKTKPYQANCNNPFTRRQEYLGIFPTELEAHKAWQAKKHEYALLLSELEEDCRIASCLCQRYSPDKNWTNI